MSPSDSTSEEKLLDAEQLRLAYGDFYAARAQLALDLTHIPSGLRQLAHYAAFWGITDDLEREALVRSAPRKVLANLKWVVREFDDALDDWLAGPESSSVSPSQEYIAFSAMRMASDFA